MKCLIQRVKYASVTVDGEVTGEIDEGYLILFGASQTDEVGIADAMAKKVVNLRIFEDENGKMNLSLLDVGGEALIVSQFTLYANCKHGNRPSFIEACEPVRANEIYEYFCEKVESFGVRVKKGVFGADMKVELLNDGPVTIMLDSEEIVKGKAK